MAIDHKDRHILAQLDRNGRMSLSDIGREVGLSRTSVRERITRMEGDGIILGFRVLQGAGGSAQERGLIFVAVREWPDQQALSWMASLPGVRRLWSIGAEWHAILAVSVAGPADLKRLTTKIGNHHLIARAEGHLVDRAM